MIFDILLLEAQYLLAIFKAEGVEWPMICKRSGDDKLSDDPKYNVIIVMGTPQEYRKHIEMELRVRLGSTYYTLKWFDEWLHSDACCEEKLMFK